MYHLALRPASDFNPRTFSSRSADKQLKAGYEVVKSYFPQLCAEEFDTGHDSTQCPNTHVLLPNIPVTDIDAKVAHITRLLEASYYQTCDPADRVSPKDVHALLTPFLLELDTGLLARLIRRSPFWANQESYEFFMLRRVKPGAQNALRAMCAPPLLPPSSESKRDDRGSSSSSAASSMDVDPSAGTKLVCWCVGVLRVLRVLVCGVCVACVRGVSCVVRARCAVECVCAVCALCAGRVCCGVRVCCVSQSLWRRFYTLLPPPKP